VSHTARRVLVVAIVAIAVFAAISVYGEIGDVGDRLSRFAWWTIGGAWMLALVSFALRFARWHLYLRTRGLEVPQQTSLQIFLAGLALSITPGKAGEIIKSYLLRTLYGVPMAETTPLVVAERVTDLVAFLVLGLTGVILYDVGRSTVLVGLAVLTCGVGVIVSGRLAAWGIDRVTSFRILNKWRAPLHQLHAGVVELLRPWPLCWATAIGVIAWLAEAAAFALIVSGFPGTDVPLGLAILIYSTTILAGALSFVPGGLLVTEAGMTLLLVSSSRGVDQSSAAAATILTRLVTLWHAVGLGVISLALLRRRADLPAQSLDSK
jgi:glycosyltransferase 2 family protein